MDTASMFLQSINVPLRSPRPFPADMEVVFLNVDEEGVIYECEGDIEYMLGYSPKSLLGRHVSLILPRLNYAIPDEDGESNPALDYLCRIGLLFLVRRRDHDQLLCHLSMIDLPYSGTPHLRLKISRSS